MLKLSSNDTVTGKRGFRKKMSFSNLDKVQDYSKLADNEDDALEEAQAKVVIMKTMMEVLEEEQED